MQSDKSRESRQSQVLSQAQHGNNFVGAERQKPSKSSVNSWNNNLTPQHNEGNGNRKVFPGSKQLTSYGVNSQSDSKDVDSKFRSERSEISNNTHLGLDRSEVKKGGAYTNDQLKGLYQKFDESGVFKGPETKDLRITDWGYSGSGTRLNAFYDWLAQDPASRQPIIDNGGINRPNPLDPQIIDNGGIARPNPLDPQIIDNGGIDRPNPLDPQIIDNGGIDRPNPLDPQIIDAGGIARPNPLDPQLIDDGGLTHDEKVNPDATILPNLANQALHRLDDYIHMFLREIHQK